MTVCSSNSLKRKFFHGEGRVFPEGESLPELWRNNRAAWKTNASPERYRFYRSRDELCPRRFFPHKKNHGSARCCLLSTILRRFSKITAIVDGSRRLSTNRKRCRFSPEAEFRTKARKIIDPISDYYHDIISTERGRSAKRSAERRARDDRDREKVCNSWNNREGKWIFSPAIPSNRGNSNNRP